MAWIGILKKIVAWIETHTRWIEELQGDMNTQQSVKASIPNPDILLSWDSQKNNYHNVRVLCDLAGLTLEEKNLICACIYQESEFLNSAVNHNKNKQGIVTSTDWGICQINDYFHIAPSGSPFPSVQYVVNNPDKMVQFMISMYQHGALKQWCSYSSGAYKQWLKPKSPMWSLSA